MRNIEVAIALLFGYFIAWLTRKDGQKYVTNANIVVSDNITFLWRQWFGIGFYSPALLRAYLVIGLCNMLHSDVAVMVAIPSVFA